MNKSSTLEAILGLRVIINRANRLMESAHIQYVKGLPPGMVGRVNADFQDVSAILNGLKTRLISAQVCVETSPGGVFGAPPSMQSTPQGMTEVDRAVFDIQAAAPLPDAPVVEAEEIDVEPVV
jgi:hypothetical protein